MKTTYSERPEDIAKVVEDIAHFLRAEWAGSDHFEPWPGLPSTPGTQPTLEQANFFFLGCCIDLQERYKVAWEKARQFFTITVPPSERKCLWRWISNHSEEEWVQHAQDYKLHRFPAFHKRIHRIARSLQEQFGGDPRAIWASNNASRLLPILEEDLEVGPALSRMIVGALRDHRLIKLEKTDFKPDRHVCLQMHRLGLAQTSKPADVLTVARKYFSDPWVVDSALFYLSAELGITDCRGFIDFHKRMAVWINWRSHIARQLMTIRPKIHQQLGKDGWLVDIESSPHWSGFYVARRNGTLREAMSEDGSALWVWIGVGYYREFVSAIELGGKEIFLKSPMLRKQLKDIGFGPGEENRDPFSDQLSFWRQQRISQLGESELPFCFKEMAGTARDLILTIEDNLHSTH